MTSSSFTLKPTTAQTMFMSIIAELPSPANMPWSDATEQMYLLGLRGVPDAGLPKLCEAVLDRCKWRPAVAEIKEIWGRLTATAPSPTAADVVAELSTLVQEYGAFGRIDQACRNLRFLGPPAGISAPALAVARCWGGWERYANDESPPGVKRGQALKIAEMVLRGDDDGRARLEHQAQSMLDAPFGGASQDVLSGL